MNTPEAPGPAPGAARGLVGVLSDSHGRWRITRRAISRLVEHGAGTFIHLGDLESEAVLEELAGLDARVVFGNCDSDESQLRAHAARLGIRIEHPASVLALPRDVAAPGAPATIRIAFTHGHLPGCVDALLASRPEYLLLGHSHRMRDERHGPTRIVNPGALFRADRYTVALIDPQADQVRFLDVPGSSSSDA
ncbi:MAG: metallophosphoesterase family protein [Phycisphaeraceae bacterium]|nr:metallophosphoesterase family protein [Phycisphaeraceae bacterium]